MSFQIHWEDPGGNGKYVWEIGVCNSEKNSAHMCMAFLVSFEDLNMPDTVLGSGNVKTNSSFIQYLLNTYRCCVLVFALWEVPSQQDKSGTKSRTV